MTLRRIPVSACGLCGGTKFQAVVENAQDHLAGSGIYTINSCVACGYVFTDPQIDPADLPALYSNPALPDFVQSSFLTDFARGLSVGREIDNLMTLSGWSKDRTLRVLDYSCGDGFFAAAWLGKRPGDSVLATDFQEKPPPRLRSSNVQWRSHAEFSATNDLFDLIVLRHVLEHTPTPKTLIADLSHRLTPHGMLAITVPNFESITQAVFGRWHFALHLPFHYSHFTRRSLTGLVAGRERVVLADSTVVVMGASIGNILGTHRLTNTNLFGLALVPIQILAERLARKPSALLMLCTRS